MELPFTNSGCTIAAAANGGNGPYVPPRNSCNTTYSNDAVTCQAFYDAMGNRNEVSVVISSRHVSRECDGLVFYVSAGNSIGKSDSQALKAAFQTAVQWPADSLVLAPLCKSDGVACILTTIAAPNLCIRDQPLNYSIVFNWTSGTKTIPVLSNRAEDEIVYLAIMNDIPFNEIYSVMVSVSVMAPSGSLVGAARGTVQAGCGSTMHIGESDFCDVYTIIPGCICFILMLPMLVLMGVLIRNENDANKRTRGTVRVQAEIINPLYTEALEMSGHTYEHIAKYQQQPATK
ncbi:hypothetical protein EMCRGX_G012069 [Ephydatia muelleri]